MKKCSVTAVMRELGGSLDAGAVLVLTSLVAGHILTDKLGLLPQCKLVLLGLSVKEAMTTLNFLFILGRRTEGSLEKDH